MASAEGFVMGAGALAFAGSFKEAGGFPPNGYAVLAGTATLTFLASLAKGSAIASPVRGLALLMLLAAALRYIPVIVPMKSGRKSRNG